jgi:hypothetical protein
MPSDRCSLKDPLKKTSVKLLSNIMPSGSRPRKIRKKRIMLSIRRRPKRSRRSYGRLFRKSTRA